MEIHGLQKMTLLDYPGYVAAAVFLGGCDFRCPYCHNAELIDGTAQPVMSDAELIKFLEKRKGLLDGVVITGGEPCLRSDLKELIEKISQLGYRIKLDTNGNHPDELRELVMSGLIQYVAMDIKNSIPKYGKTIGIKGFDTKNVEKSIALLLEGKVDYEFRTTVVAELHDENDFELIGDMLHGARAYYLQQYVERESVPDKSLSAPEIDELDRYLGILKSKGINAFIRGA